MNDHEEEKKTRHNLFVSSGISEAQVTNNRRLLSTNCTVEATDRHEALRGLCDSRLLLSSAVSRVQQI